MPARQRPSQLLHQQQRARTARKRILKADRSKNSAPTFLTRLSGRKQLVFGENDSACAASGRTSSSNQIERLVDGRRIVTMHYGLRIRNGMRKSFVMLHGHSRGRPPGFRVGNDGAGTLDVGADSREFAPTTLSDILRRSAALPALPLSDHHHPDAGEERKRK